MKLGQTFHEFSSWSNAVLFKLAHLAQTEDWDYRDSTSEHSLPILRSYVAYTFRRAQFQERVLLGTSKDGTKVAAFNTGLLTNHFEQIFSYFVPQTKAEYQQDWVLVDFARESDYRLMAFQELPERATYFDRPEELLYDSNLDLRIQYEHIVNDNVDRFPVNLRNDERRRVEVVRQAVEHAKFRVQQNYKTAIPQFYWRTRDAFEPGKVQLLLPLCLHDFGRADLALSVEREGSVYRAATVLTLDMAYNNARLIARPDREWLEPMIPNASDLQ